MAIMIPNELPGGTQWFENILFEKFKEAPVDWKVFPNYFVKNSRNEMQPRELDFVILIPESCAVVYLEAKSGTYRWSRRQWWRRKEKSKSPPAQAVSDMYEKSKSPPAQAVSGMYELKNQFSSSLRNRGERGNRGERDPDVRITFASAVAFSDLTICENAKTDPDCNNGSLLIGGAEVQAGNSIRRILGEYVEAMRERPNYAKALKMKGNGADDEELQAYRNYLETLEQFQALEEMLNPPDMAVTRNTFVRANLETLLPELLKPTHEQTFLLDSTRSNSRCVIDGAAGTGKTVLAMQVARERCEDYGETIGLLCSNPNLSSRFERWAETLSNERGGKVLAGTPSTLLSSTFSEDDAFLSKHRQRLEASPNLEGTLKRGDFDNGWRGFVDETLTDLEGRPPLFDYLIVDEAQNLCDDVFLKLVDRLLKGGLVDGRWAMFGDFVNQNIVTPRREKSGDAKAALKPFGTHYTNVTLRTNCRNTHEIAAATYNITDIESPTLPGVHGPKVEFQYFGSADEIDDMLDKKLNEWESDRFESRQIILLAADDSGVFDGKRRYGKWDLVNIREVPPGGDIRVSGENSPSIRYSEIQDFQGLESDLVILVLPMTAGQTKIGGMITLPHQNYLNRLLYVALSRANAMLVVMADEGYRQHLEPHI